MAIIKNQKLLPITLGVVFPSIAFAFVLWNISSIGGMLSKLISVLSPVIIGCVIAFVVNIPMMFLEKKLLFNLKNKKPKLCRSICMLLSFLFIIGVLTILGLIIVPEIADTVRSLYKTLPFAVVGVYNDLKDLLWGFGVDLGEFFNLSSLTSYVNQIISSASVVMNGAVGVAASIFSILFDILMGLCLAIFMLSGKERILHFFRRLFKAAMPKKTAEKFFKVTSLTNSCFRNFVAAQITEAMILGVLCFIGMSIFRFPFAMTVSAIVGFTALIPIVGAWAGAAIGAVLILSVNPVRALLFVVFLIVLQQLEGNLIYPKVVGSSVGIPGVLVLIAITVGGGYGGIGGMLLSVPVSAVLFALSKEFILKKEDEEEVLTSEIEQSEQ